MHNEFNRGFPMEGCAPDPQFVNPYSELARCDPVVAIAIEQAREVGQATTESRFIRDLARKAEADLSETKDQLQRAKREQVYLQNNLDNAYEERDEAQEKVAKLEKKVKPTKKVVKKAKKVSKK